LSICDFCSSGSPSDRCGDCSLLPARPPHEPNQGHVVVARSIVARLRHQRLEVLLRPHPVRADRFPGGLSLLRALQQPRRKRIGSEEEDLVLLENSFDHPDVRKRIVARPLQGSDQERTRAEFLGTAQGKGLRELLVPRHVQQAAVADRHRAPPPVHRVQRRSDERGVRSSTRLLRRVPG